VSASWLRRTDALVRFGDPVEPAEDREGLAERLHPAALAGFGPGRGPETCAWKPPAPRV